MEPRLSYTIWFSQRTGSTLLTETLEAIGIAGIPHEWLLELKDYPVSDPAELQRYLWKIGSTMNGIFGLKHSFCEPHFSHLIEIFRQFSTCPSTEQNRANIWEHAFPNHRHIFMTRRNKVRLAVSWWKAIKSQEWHRRAMASPKSVDLSGAYSFDAIHHLYRECSMREAGIQEFFSDITARAPERSMSRPTQAEVNPMASKATLKPRKTVVIVHPVSAAIGLASTPRQ